MHVLTLLVLPGLFPDPAPAIQWIGPHCGVEEARVELITDFEGLTEAWKTTHGGSSDGQPLVNFDRCRLVLVINGTDTEVFGVTAIDLDRTRREIQLGVDARGSQSLGDGKPEETTAWGLFIVPRTPAPIIVRENVSGVLGGDPEWNIIARLGPGPRPAVKPAADRNGEPLEPDLSLLQPRRQQDRDRDVAGDPYIALFERGNKQLLFVAARHEQDIENDPTHRLVREGMARFRPQAVIIEGVSTSQGEAPERFMRNATRRVATGRAAESMYAAVLASEQGAVVIGGEPDAEVTPRVVREAGYANEDLLGFLLARRAVGMVRNDRIDDGFTEPANRALRELKRKYRIESDFDADDFQAWYQEHLGEPFNPRRVKREVSPMKVDNPTILREMAILVMTAREHNLVTLEAKLLNEHDRVMVVYGSGHLRWERALLEDMMGPPVFVSQEVPGDDTSHHGEHDAELMRKPWTAAVPEPPRYIVSDQYGAHWVDKVREGIDVARNYLGNYGPVCIFILGQEDDELEDPASAERIMQAYCDLHLDGSDRPMQDCLDGEGAELIEKARSGSTDAYMSMAMESDPPVAELVFINAHQFGEADIHTRGIHEYTHVYQKAFPFTPTWMMEGGAELLACHLGEQNGWGHRGETMKWYARHLEEAEGLEYTIRDMEEIETADPDVAAWHRELGYDAGAWAVAYLVDRSRSRSIRAYFTTFYPAVHEAGWQQALCNYTDLDQVEDFYTGFDAFMAQPLEDRLAMLASLKD